MDVAIIGAGKSCFQRAGNLRSRLPLTLGSGIAFARFYLDTHPDCRLTILEKDGCIGGVWSASV